MAYMNWIVAISLTLSTAAFGQQTPSSSNRAPDGSKPVEVGEVGEAPGCPCVAGTPEAEPNCGVPTDTVDGGCNSDPEVFKAITPGATFCGTADWNSTTPFFRDTDWYEYTVTTRQTLLWQVEAEFPALILVIDGNNGCPAPNLDFDFTTGCGDTGKILITLDPGTYYFFVAPDFDGPTLPCGAEYTASLILADDPQSVPAMSPAALVGTAIAFAIAGASLLYLRRRLGGRQAI